MQFEKLKTSSQVKERISNLQLAAAAIRKGWTHSDLRRRPLISIENEIAGLEKHLKKIQNPPLFE